MPVMREPVNVNVARMSSAAHVTGASADIGISTLKKDVRSVRATKMEVKIRLAIPIPGSAFVRRALRA